MMVALMYNATSTANLFSNLPALPQGYKLMGFGMFPAAAQHRAYSMHMLLLSFAIATAMLLYWHVLMCSCVFLCCCCCPVAPLSLSCLQLDPKSIAATYKRVRIFGEGATGAHALRVELWGCGVLQRKMLTLQTPPHRPLRSSTSGPDNHGS